MIRGFVLALVVSLQLASALGQVAVRGVVKDATGATVLAATASIQSSAIDESDAVNAKQIWESITGADGTFSFTLPVGRYKLCVVASGFQTNCTEFSVRDVPFLTLDVRLQVNPNTALAPSSVMDDRLREISGDRAMNCGRVRIGDNPAEATVCVLHQFQSGEPFRVRYDVQGIDSEVLSAW